MANKSMTELANKIAKLVKEKFDSLPKNGKPQSRNEWTVVSAIIQEYKQDLKIVSLCTGSKCLGQNDIPIDGSRVNDSHAEILARRCFLKYLYNELIQCEKSTYNYSIFEKSEHFYQLKTGVEFHLFSTEIPCGDAVIAPKENNANDIYRTGAKCLPDSVYKDLRLPGVEYHTVSAIRTKPGRGDPTLSVSCSDKILKWNYMGIQGALLTIIINQPIYLKSLILAGGIKLSINALNRALNDRFYTMNQFKNFGVFSKHKLEIYQSSVEFPYQRCTSKQACPISICWTNITDKPIEVIVNGRKHGITLKHINKKSIRVSICKKELFELFKYLLMNDACFKTKLNCHNIESMTYLESKLLATEYNNVWRFVKFNIFPTWPLKNPKLLEFV